MHLLTRVAATLGMVAFAVATSFVGTHSLAAAPNVVGHVFVNDNIAGTNTIGAFNRLANGALVPMRGSPFAAGGAGTGQSIGAKARSRSPATAAI
jgi:hypothetical protein